MARSSAARQRNVGVFIDAENLFKGYGKLEIPDVSMADILELVEREAGEEAGAGGIAVAHAYADWNRLGLEDFRRDVERDGVRTMQVFAAGAPTKNAADIELVVDCLRFATERESIEVFVIVSGDGDFVPLVRRLHELGKYVVGATLAEHDVNSLLREEADLYVSIPVAAKKKAEPKKPPAKKVPAKKAEPQKKAAEPEKKAKPQKKAAQKKPAKKAAPPPVEEPVPSSTPNWHALAKDIGVVVTGPASSPEQYKEAIAKLLATPKFHSYCDKLVARGGTLPLLAMAIRAAAPELSPSAVGVRNLSRALRFALAGTGYALAQGPDDVQPVLVHRRSKPADMLPDLPLDESPETPVKKAATKKSPAKKAPAKKVAKSTAKTPAEQSAAVAPDARSKTPSWNELSRRIGLVHEGPVSSPEEYKKVFRTLLDVPAFHSYCDKLVAHGGTLQALALALQVAAPELSPSSVGARSLSRLLRYALTGTAYALARGDDDTQQPVLVRRGSKPANMLPDLSVEEIR